MDPIKNPFAPGAGSPPPELAGRTEVLSRARVAIARIGQGRPAKSLILVGLRGVGKTVLLVRIKELAEDDGFKAGIIEAHEGKSLPGLLVPTLRQILFSLDTIASARDKAKRGLRVLLSFVRSAKLTIGDYDIGLSIDPERGTADSGDLEADLGQLLIAVGEAARAAGKAIAICIDELQYLSEAEFSALIMAIHKITQNQLPIVVIGAGLPQIIVWRIQVIRRAPVRLSNGWSAIRVRCACCNRAPHGGAGGALHRSSNCGDFAKNRTVSLLSTAVGTRSLEHCGGFTDPHR